MKKKSLVAIICVLMLAFGGMATLAYLTDDEKATNTFTVGDVQIKLDEADVKTDGTLDTNERVQENEYHLIPGHTYIKDPTVTVLEDSEAVYVRMIVNVVNIDKLRDAIPATENPTFYNGELFLLQNLCNEWDSETWNYVRYDEVTDEETNITTGKYEFRYKEVVPATKADIPLMPLFESITVPGSIDNDHLAFLDAVDIVVEAHAIQADGFENADAAWVEFK